MTRAVVVTRGQVLPEWVPVIARREIADAMAESLGVVVAEEAGEFCFWHLGSGAEVELALWLAGLVGAGS